MITADRAHPSIGARGIRAPTPGHDGRRRGPPSPFASQARRVQPAASIEPPAARAHRPRRHPARAAVAATRRRPPKGFSTVCRPPRRGGRRPERFDREARRVWLSVRRFLDQVGNPLEWGDIDKILIVQAVAVPGMAGGVLRLFYLIAHPETEPYYDRHMLEVMSALMIAFLIITAGLTILGLHLRATAGPHRLYLHVVNQTWWLTFGVLTYLHGLATTPLWTFFPFIGFICL